MYEQEQYKFCTARAHHTNINSLRYSNRWLFSLEREPLAQGGRTKKSIYSTDFRLVCNVELFVWVLPEQLVSVSRSRHPRRVAGRAARELRVEVERIVRPGHRWTERRHHLI